MNEQRMKTIGGGFGLCPRCEGEPMHIGVAVSPGRHKLDNCFVCHDCKVAWWAGSGLISWPFDYPPPATPEEAGFGDYECVEPLWEERQVPMTAEECELIGSFGEPPFDDLAPEALLAGIHELPFGGTSDAPKRIQALFPLTLEDDGRDYPVAAGEVVAVGTEGPFYDRAACSVNHGEAKWTDQDVGMHSLTNLENYQIHVRSMLHRLNSEIDVVRAALERVAPDSRHEPTLLAMSGMLDASYGRAFAAMRFGRYEHLPF